MVETGCWMYRLILSIPCVSRTMNEGSPTHDREEALRPDASTVDRHQEMGGATTSFTRASANPDNRIPSDPPAGAQIGKYQIVDMIGRGGMGLVYRAVNPDLKGTVALKVIRTGDHASSSEVRRFALECAALVRFRHPNIVAVYDAGEHQGQPFLVMEYLGGGSLTRHLARFQSDLRSAVALIQKVALAVGVLHASGVLHRDLKPSNVLLDEAGEPRVGDFGLVKLLDSADELTQTGQHVGTPPYMAPEQTEYATTNVSPQTDVWALGVILYELVLGRRPFIASNRAALWKQIATIDPENPRKIRPDLNRDLEAVMLRCLQKSPPRRFATAGELADELSRWLNGTATQTRPDGPLRRLAVGIRRRPIRTAALAILVLMIPLLPLLIALSRSPRDRSESLPDPLEAIQQRIGQGQEVPLVPTKGRLAWSQWFVSKTAKDTVSADGYFTVEAFEEGTMLELARELPVSAYTLRARVRHNKVTRQGTVGIYVGGRSARGTGGVGHFFFALHYNGITDERKLLEQSLREADPGKPPVLPPGNAVSLNAYLHVHPDLGPWWGRGFGGVDGVWLKPSGFGADKWRDLEITILPGSFKAKSLTATPPFCKPPPYR